LRNKNHYIASRKFIPSCLNSFPGILILHRENEVKYAVLISCPNNLVIEKQLDQFFISSQMKIDDQKN